ncbi:MAG TPA: hypothetical protein DCS36_02675 [Sphingobacterium sp.]|nr:hypothetical protein [Sphingobacterium sp.]
MVFFFIHQGGSITIPIDIQASKSYVYPDILLAHYEDMGITLLQSLSDPSAFFNFFRNVPVTDMDDDKMLLAGLGIAHKYT